MNFVQKRKNLHKSIKVEKYIFADLEMRLSWQPVSYWIPTFVRPRFKVSTKGTDWLAPTLGTVTKWAWLLCMQALLFTGTPCCKHPLVHTLEVPFLRVSLHLKLLRWAWVQVKQRLLSEINLRISGELSLPDPQYLPREKWLASNPILYTWRRV